MKKLFATTAATLCCMNVHAVTLSRSSAPASAQASLRAACPAGPGHLSHNVDCAPTVPNTVACGGTGLVTTAENSYYRRYVFAPTTPANAMVTTVRYAIENATGSGTEITGAQIRLHTIPTGTALTTAALTQIGSVPLTVTIGTSAAELSATVSPAAIVDSPTTKDLVVELFQPVLTELGQALVYGSNNTGTGTTFLRAPACGAAQPTDIAGLGFPQVKIIASISGSGLPVELQAYAVD